MEADFSGYATKYGVKCSDGRTIAHGAFKHLDKKKVPLVWAHRHEGPENVLGHVLFEHRQDGVYAHAFFNETEKGQMTKTLVQHGDVESLSIWANNLNEKNKFVSHGDIRETSIVLAGANPGALIDNVYIQHGEDYDTVDGEAFIYSGFQLPAYTLAHSAEDGDNQAGDNVPDEEQEPSDGVLQHEEGSAEEAQAVYDSMSDGQKQFFHSMVAAALATNNVTDTNVEHEQDPSDGTNADGTTTDGGESLQHQEGNDNMNVFEMNASQVLVHNDGGDVLTHDALTPKQKLTPAQVKTIFADVTSKKISIEEAILAHAEDYGITNPELLFPDARAIANTPQFVKRRTEWVDDVLSGVNKLPWSRVKSVFADITQDSARAKGYITGTLKKEEWFGLTKRVTTPQTIYKKQKLDRDDILDITELDVVAWIKAEMRLMLEEEIARAILIGDGREVDDPDKIKDPASISDGQGIRSIANDHEFYSHVVELPANIGAQDASEQVIRSFEWYRGSGNPAMFSSRGFYVDMLLAKDRNKRRLYDTKASLEAALGVAKVVPVELMSEVPNVLAIIVNLRDYAVGTDRGGQVTMFEDFDIDWNQEKYLLETRMSGGLTMWKSALIIKRGTGTLVTWDNSFVPTFVPATGVVTIPTKTGVAYYNDETDALLTAGAQSALAAGASISIEARPTTGYQLPFNLDADWDFTRPTA